MAISSFCSLFFGVSVCVAIKWLNIVNCISDQTLTVSVIRDILVSQKELVSVGSSSLWLCSGFPSIKLQILLLCFHTFLTEVVGRSC